LQFIVNETKKYSVLINTQTPQTKISWLIKKRINQNIFQPVFPAEVEPKDASLEHINAFGSLSQKLIFRRERNRYSL